MGERLDIVDFGIGGAPLVGCKTHGDDGSLVVAIGEELDKTGVIEAAGMPPTAENLAVLLILEKRTASYVAAARDRIGERVVACVRPIVFPIAPTGVVIRALRARLQREHGIDAVSLSLFRHIGIDGMGSVVGAVAEVERDIPHIGFQAGAVIVKLIVVWPPRAAVDSRNKTRGLRREE